MTLAAVSDAGPLIHLAEIDALERPSVSDPLLIPEAVPGETESGGVPDVISDLSYELDADGDESESWTRENALRSRSAGTDLHSNSMEPDWIESNVSTTPPADDRGSRFVVPTS